MRVAIIDLGTNSIRFDVHEITSNRKGVILHRRLYREKTMVRLGQDLFLAGRLSTEGKRRTIEAVQSFKTTMNALDIDKVVAFGTAAVRDASDGDQFIKDLGTKTGVKFRIITGAEEAALIGKGILFFEKNIPPGIHALIDIGGGSTEISICKGRKILHSHSFNLGVAKLQQIFLKTQPPIKTKKSDPVEELREFIRSAIQPKIKSEKWPKKVNTLTGSSGSVIAISKLIHKDKNATKKNFSTRELSKIAKTLKEKTPAEILSMKGVEPKRVDLILAGAILLDEICRIFKVKQVKTTEYALRDGILEDELEHYHQASPKRAPFSIEEVEKRLAHWNMDHGHARTNRKNAEWLFDELKSVHKLKPSWKNYLSAAALLHDVGEIVSHSNHSEHSEYIIKNAHIVSMHDWETNLVAHIARYHKEEKVLEKAKIPYDKKNGLRDVFLKLLALLQLADSMDRSHKSPLVLKSKKLGKKKIEIYFKSKSPCDLEILRFDQKKLLFEQLFKREIILKRIR